MDNFDITAFFGTGQCDPYKDLWETLIALAILIGWWVIIMLIIKVKRSGVGIAYKVVGMTILISLGVCTTLGVVFMTLLGFACSG